jgi:hypothetical protein
MGKVPEGLKNYQKGSRGKSEAPKGKGKLPPFQKGKKKSK